jgi:uncharacterized protein DUF6178
MTNEKQHSPTVSVEERIQRLKMKRAAVMDLPPEKKRGEILSFAQPAALVHAFGEQDFLLLVEEVGPDDALELIALASDRQWEHLLDSRIWDGDRVDVTRMTRWFDRLFRTDARRTVRWLADERVELLELYLLRNIHIVIKDPERDDSELPDGFFTFDDTFYMQIPELASEADDDDPDLRPRFLRELLGRLAATDHLQLQRILLETIRILPAEVEEEEWRRRGFRMAEKGFLPFDEAIGIYQPMDPASLSERPPVRNSNGAGDTVRAPAPLYPVRLAVTGNLFSLALDRVAVPDRLESLQTEFAALCNRLVVADREPVRGREQLAGVVRKACGYLQLGLAQLWPEPSGPDPGQAVDLIQRHGLEALFRVGHGACLKLKWRAERWRDRSWFTATGLPLTFWDEAWTGVLGGLLIKKPLFYDNYRTGGTLYREFETMADLRGTETMLDRIIAVDDILSRMKVDMASTRDRTQLTWKCFLLTLWLRHCLGLAASPSALDMGQLRQAFDALWPGAATLDFNDQGVKRSFLSWLAEGTGLAPVAVSARIDSVLEALFGELSEEYGRVRKGDLDSRFLRHFLVSSPGR